MNRDRIVIGLTGQTGSGKTTVCKVFLNEGCYIIDCDRVARDVTLDGSDCCRELSLHFPACFDSKLHLDRRALGKEVFSDGKKLELLNSIIFPYINREIEARIRASADSGAWLILLDAPTLFEAGADRFCDVIVACTADKELRLERIMRRDGLDRLTASERIDSQLSEEFFRSRADYIIENNGTQEQAEAQALAAVQVIKKEYYCRNKEKENGGQETTREEAEQQKE